jgi:hypothetical protein
VAAVSEQTLSEFLLARLSVDEGRARAALGLLGIETEWHRVEWLRERGLTIADAQHMTHHAPRRVLAEREAKRRIVEEYAPVAKNDTGESEPEYAYGWAEGLGEAVRLLALPYADHPDYRDEWRP